ncbi:lipid A ethanolaminephosphotransferase [Patescibacteria group bacterium]|nr:lipid A ethanolaminephosphotransferase [Patescibacteria group bacterium]
MTILNRLLFPKLSLTPLIIITALFITIFDNQAFLNAVFKIIDNTGLASDNFKIALFVSLVLLFSLFLSLVAAKYIFKPFAILILLIASVISFFMDNYGVIIDVSMIKNIVETDTKEALELISINLIKHVLIFGVLPAITLCFIKIKYHSVFKEIIIRLFSFLLMAVILSTIIFFYYKDFSLIDRNNRALRYFINPNYPVYALAKYINHASVNEIIKLTPIGKDAQQVNNWKARSKKSIVVIVVGETARAQNFSLNGYERNTNPLLSQHNIINYPDTHACGTATADSVPCMFSDFGHDDYTDTKAKQYENLLDVLSHAGIDILWRDNNSGCKGVCNRVSTEQLDKLTDAEFCKSGECFDEILLKDLQTKISAFKNDAVIVLHQKGSHGPSYYLRHPDNFKTFVPECAINQVQDCPREQIVNAYDNTILYTDYFLNKVIEFLKSQTQYNTAMLYFSDHGESLGENGIYLHGLPYKFAPKEQTHIPFITWLSDDYANSFNIDMECLKQHSYETYSHDNLFHSVLGMLDIQTLEYDPELDIFNRCRH